MTPDGYRYEHRVVMEQQLGRKLDRSEHVHHRNGDKLDNRIENLEVISHSDHSRHHGKERALPDNRLKPGQWSRKFGDRCADCGTTELPHFSRGFCRNCHARWYRRNR